MILTTHCKDLVKPVVFLDIGSTLVTSGPDSLAPHKQIIKLYNDTVKPISPASQQIIDLEQRIMTQPIDRTLLPTIASILNVDNDRNLDIVVKTVVRDQLTEIDYIDGAVEFVQRLNMCGIEYHLVSNIWEPYYHGFLRLFGQHMSNSTTKQFLSYAVGAAKPSSKLYAYACNSIGYLDDEARRQIIMIGDSYNNDMSPAIAKQLKTCWLLHRPEKEAKFIEQVNAGKLYRPDLTVSSIANVRIDDLINIVNPR